jgi:hypothetical protein
VSFPPPQIPHRLVRNADEIGGGGGSQYKLPGPGRGPGTRLCCKCFCLSRYYHNLPAVQINPFRPSPSHSASRVSLRFSMKIFSRSALAVGGFKRFSHRGLNPLPAALLVRDRTRTFVVKCALALERPFKNGKTGSTFLSNFPRLPKEHCFLEGSQASPIFPGKSSM